MCDKESSCCTNEVNEEAIIERVLAGDTASVCELFGRYDSQAKAIARRFLAWDESRIEDAIQEAMMKAYLNLHRLRDRTKFKHWYFKIVRNISLDCAKRQNIYADFPDDDSWDYQSWRAFRNNDLDDVPESFFMADVIERVREELDELDSDYGEPIRMRYMEELSYNEIADLLHKPLGTVKSLIHRGKAILKERIDARVEAGV